MPKHMRMLIPAVLAAGAMVLTACDQSSPAAEGGQTTPVTTTSSTSATGDSTTAGSTTAESTSAGGDDAADPAGTQAVDCGQVDVDGTKQTLTADPGAGGVVGCTEAFNVLDAYLAIPASERGAAIEGSDVEGGWHCTTNDGETAGVGCVKGSRGDQAWDFAFYTKPV